MKNYLKQGTLPFLQKLSKALGKDLVFVDLETTGFVNAQNFAIFEVGIVIVITALPWPQQHPTTHRIGHQPVAKPKPAVGPSSS